MSNAARRDAAFAECRWTLPRAASPGVSDKHSCPQPLVTTSTEPSLAMVCSEAHVHVSSLRGSMNADRARRNNSEFTAGCIRSGVFRARTSRRAWIRRSCPATLRRTGRWRSIAVSICVLAPILTSAPSRVALAAGTPPAAGGVIFNEYASDNDAAGNDFFELLVLRDHVDLRGYALPTTSWSAAFSTTTNRCSCSATRCLPERSAHAARSLRSGP